MREKIKKSAHVIFWHNHYPAKSRNNPYFGRGGDIHKITEKMTKNKLCWKFIGGFINDERDDFWESIAKADVLFSLPANMDYNDIGMHWDGAEKSMLDVLTKVKERNPNIKVFFFENDVHHLEDELSTLGEFITDLHGDESVIKYFKKFFAKVKK
ncbi:MAG: hypothetical protein PHE20_02720 [Patescibacteria group bacterium]|nr:hypothetical protein [Patescibacteria group bacterium]